MANIYNSANELVENGNSSLTSSGSISTAIEEYSKEQLYELAFFERVTNYYNWNWMREKLIRFEEFGIEDFAFVHFDVKDFKMVNEIYNHDIADNLLRRICHAMRDSDWVHFSCRCDNDNFAMIIKKMPNEEIRQKLEEFFSGLSKLEEDKTYPIYFRCGVASINNVKDYRVLITDMAKMAQNMGKSANTTEINFYTDEMKEEQIRSKILKNDLQRAFDEDEFLVYFQPKYEPKDNTVVGAEALIRWNLHHEKILPPGMFVPYLEKEGAIELIDRFVLEQVCKKLEEWKKQGIKIVPISVNMSRSQLYSPVVIQNIMSIVEKYDIDRKYIEFELTESMAYDDINYMISVMNELRNLGFLLSIDDFGTGYSSLNMLSSMPFTTIKIDKSFIDEIETDEEGKVSYIVKDILSLTKHLKINSLAEGVETSGQRDLIKEWGCDYIQGYFYSKPLPEEKFEEILKNDHLTKKCWC